MRIKKLWELYKELRRLRKKVRILEADLAEVNRKYNGLRGDYTAILHSKVCGLQDAQPDRMSFMIPQRGAFDSPYIAVPEQKHVFDKISTRMKVKFFDDLLEQGYIRCTHCDDVSEVYEIQVIKQSNP